MSEIEEPKVFVSWARKSQEHCEHCNILVNRKEIFGMHYYKKRDAKFFSIIKELTFGIGRKNQNTNTEQVTVCCLVVCLFVYTFF